MRSFKSYSLVFLCVLTACTTDDGPLEVDGGLDGGGEAAEADREQPTRAEPDEPKDKPAEKPADKPAEKPEDRPKAPIDGSIPFTQVTPDAGLPEPSMTPDASAPDAATPTPPEADAGTPAPDAPSGSTPNDNPSTTSSEIETVVMDLVTTVGIGGTIIQDPRPMILFKDGWACREMNFVVRGLDEATHRAMFPKAWVQWQLVDGKVALQNANGGWTKLYFQLKYAPNDESLTFEDTFTRLSGGGSWGNEIIAVQQKDLHLSSDHHVVMGSYTGVTSPNTVTQVIPPDARGTYRIDGYTIEFKWDDGKTSKTSFVYSAQDAGAIYVDGVGFITRN